MPQYYNIAGLTVEMDTFGRTQRQAIPYLCPKALPDIQITSDWKAVQMKAPELSDEDCEYLSTGACFYAYLLKHDGFLLHSSAVVVDGKAYLFSANSGTGKSTHTALWLERFGSRAYVLNDDKPALRLENGKWYAYGTPWSGKHDISRNARVPVAGICFLERGESNFIQPFGGSKAVFAFWEQTVRPAGKRVREKIMDLLENIMDNVPVWKLQCNISPEAVDVSYGAMAGDSQK